MTKDQGEQINEILNSRDGLLTEVRLVTGKILRVHNIAAGRDIGEDFHHFTTNISPQPSDTSSIDFFHADQVASIVAIESGEPLFE